MTHFQQLFIQYIKEYKDLLRKHLGSQASEAIERLGLHYSDEHCLTDQVLFYAMHDILRDCRQWLVSHRALGDTYSGLESYYEHIDALLADYTLEQNKVIHRSQVASRAYINLIQKLPSYTGAHSELGECRSLCQIMVQHGDRSIISKLHAILKDYGKQHPTLYTLSGEVARLKVESTVSTRRHRQEVN